MVVMGWLRVELFEVGVEIEIGFGVVGRGWRGRARVIWRLGGGMRS